LTERSAKIFQEQRLHRLLACPNCKGQLNIEVFLEDELGVKEGELYCLSCKQAYRIKDGIFYLQPETDVTTTYKDWSIAPFNRDYQEIGYYESALDRAEKEGIPKQVAEYFYSRVKGRLLEWLETRDDVILDIGAGSGYFIFDMMSRCTGKDNYFVGIDPSVEHIKWLEYRKRNEKISNILTIVGDAKALPFQQEAFNIITCTEVLEHISEKDQAISEISRSLKKGGMLLLTTPSKRAADFWHTLVAPFRQALKIKLGGLPYDKALSSNDLKHLLQAENLNIDEFELNVILAPQTYFRYLPFLAPVFVEIGGFAERHMKKIFAPQFALHQVLKATKK